MNSDTRLCEQYEQEPCLSHAVKQKATRMWGSQRMITVDLLMMLWGLGTWLGVNGLYVQLPLLVERLPEGWALPASMALAVQGGNAGLLLYALLRRLLPRTPDALAIAALLALGALALLLNAFLHPFTVVLGGAPRSVPFLALTLCSALVGCTSSVLFYPYLRHFRDVYLATYLVGEALSGFVPSALSLIQGGSGEPTCVPGPNGTVVAEYGEPRFGTTGFQLALAALGAGSLAAFLLLDSRHFAGARVPPGEMAKGSEACSVQLLKARWLGALAAQGVLSALANGVMPSTASYSCLPYGARAYHLATALMSAAGPAACLLCAWRRPGRRVLLLLLLLAAPALSWALATAALSPVPPLQHSTGGAAIAVLAWVAATAVVSLTRMWLFEWARPGGARGMRAVGAAGQAGSAIGSLFMFVLVNYTNTFTSAPPCPPPA